MILAMLLMIQDAGKAGLATKVKPVGSPMNWISDADYPAASLRRGEFGSVRFGLGIDKAGKVVSRHVMATSGFVELDQTACAVLLKRARFSAARDAAGQPISAAYSRGPDPTWRPKRV
jgi:protein TonB